MAGSVGPWVPSLCQPPHKQHKQYKTHKAWAQAPDIPGRVDQAHHTDDSGSLPHLGNGGWHVANRVQPALHATTGIVGTAHAGRNARPGHPGQLG